MKRIFLLKNKKNNKIYVVAKDDAHARDIGFKNRRAVSPDMFTLEDITDFMLLEYHDLQSKLPSLKYGILACYVSGSHRIWKSHENCY